MEKYIQITWKLNSINHKSLDFFLNTVAYKHDNHDRVYNTHS